jgi:hypothetical protein
MNSVHKYETVTKIMALYDVDGNKEICPQEFNKSDCWTLDLGPGGKFIADKSVLLKNEIQNP